MSPRPPCFGDRRAARQRLTSGRGEMGNPGTVSRAKPSSTSLQPPCFGGRRPARRWLKTARQERPPMRLQVLLRYGMLELLEHLLLFTWATHASRYVSGLLRYEMRRFYWRQS